MAKALSLHIGLNHVNPDAYDGWDGALDGCINDANAMKRIAESQGFTTATLIDNQATCANVTNKICDITRQLSNGDYFLLTYSGHGGQVVDNTGEEADGLNETWVLWDRQFIDNEIYNLLSQVQAGVRVFVSSDSCHSGTVIRAFLRTISQRRGVDKLNYSTEFSKFINSGARSLPQSKLRKMDNPFDGTLKKRAMPESVAIKDYENKKDIYDAARNMAGSKEKSRAAINCSVIYISGCQDNQSSYDGTVNGAFTTALLSIWNNGAFSGTYPTFHSQIRDLMDNPAQVPNYMKLGTVASSFENSKPYLVNTGASSSSGTSTSSGSGSSSSSGTAQSNPSMSASSPYNRQNNAPVFQVNKGSNPYYYVELSTDNSLFTYGNTNRNANNWFATWGDRFTASTYQIPDAVWNKFKSADRIYYRIGSTSSPVGGWNDLKVSFLNDNYAAAPYIALQDAMVTSSNGSNGSSSSNGNGGTTAEDIHGSVGAGGTNQPDDVRTIQQLLNEISDADGGSSTSPLSVDGVCGNNTISAIRRFQSKQEFAGTGLVKVSSSLLHMLLNKSGHQQ